MTCVKIKGGFVCVSGKFKPGDSAPTGYLDSQEWHEVQQKAGLRQKACGICGKYYYPQGMSNKTVEAKYQKTKYGPELTQTKPICKACEKSK